MEFLTLLWMPIVVSAVLVFIASSVIHMALKWHDADYRKLANEDEVAAAIRAGAATPGGYMIPHCGHGTDFKKPENVKKFEEGPIALITLRPPGPPKMGPTLVQWFVFTLVISAIAAYVAQKTLGPQTPFLQVCRVVSAIAFLAYGGGSVIAGIWMGKAWGSVAKDVLDAAIYATITALTFGWLWLR
jgi:hypothetical protein